MELDIIKQQTTWNDAATSINTNFAKVKQAIQLLESTGNSGLDEESLVKFLEENGYATEAYVATQISGILGGASSAFDTLKEIESILEGHEGRISTLEDKEAMFRWVTDEDGTRRIETDYDLASLGTVASGGKGKQGSTSGAGGGIMAVKVNGQTISDDDDDRIIELPDYPEKVSDLENDEGYAKSSDVAATYATKSEQTLLEKRVETNEKAIVTLKEKDTTIEEKITKIKEITDHFFIDEHGLGTHKNFRSTGTLSSGGAAQVGEGGGSGGVTGEYKMYVHTQGDPLKEWTITHNLNKVPNVKVIDSTGNQVYGDVKIENMNIVTVSFGGAFSGIAYLD